MIWPASSLANLFPAGVKRAMVKHPADSAFYNLGLLRDASVNVKELFRSDTYLRPLGYGFSLEAKLPAMQASLTELQLIHKLLNVNLHWKLDLPGSDNLTVEIPDMVGTDSVSGTHWKVVCGGGMEGERSIEYTIQGNLIDAQIDGLVTPSPTADGTANAADNLYGFSQQKKPENIKANGLKKVEFKLSTDQSYSVLGDLRGDSNYTFECLVDFGGGGRRAPRVSAIKLVGDFFLQETEDAKLNLLDTIAQSVHDIKIYHMDDVVLSLGSANVNFIVTFSSVGNIDKFRILHFHAEGAIDDISVWPNLWS